MIFSDGAKNEDRLRGNSVCFDVRAISKTHIRIAGVDHDLTNHAEN